MPPERYTPTQTARHAGISPNTVRLWAKEYREFLSGDANPPSGVDRSFTAADVAVMQAIAQLRANNISTADVKERLRQQPPTALQETTESPKQDTVVSNDLVPAHDAIQAFLARNDVTDKLESIDRRLERVESRNNTVMIAVVAFAGGAVVVAVIAWLLSIMR